MPRRPTVDTDKVLRMLFEGKSGIEIASACNVAAMTVSNVKKAFIQEAERSSLVKAAQAHGIGEQVNGLLSLQKRVNDVEGGFSAVEKGIEYAESFGKIKVDPDQVSYWIDEVYEAALGEGLEGEDVGPLLRRFSEVVGESNLGYEETLAAMEDANNKRIAEEDKVQDLEAEIERLKVLKANTDSDAKTALTSKGLTQEKLDLYAGAISSLKGKVNIDDTVVLSNLVRNLVQENRPYKGILAFYGRSLDLDKEREEKTSQNAALDESNRELEMKINDSAATLEANKETVKVLDSWKKAGLVPERGVALVRSMSEYAALHGCSKDEALTSFFSDLEEHWSPSLGFANEYKMMSGKVEVARMELSNTQKLLRETKRAYDSTISAVEAKSALNKRGVGDDDLIAWEQVLSESGTDVHTFREEMNNLGGIKIKVEKMRVEERKAEEKLTTLRTKISAETETFNRFRSANLAFRKHFDEVVDPLFEKVQRKMEELEAKMLDEETGIESRMEEVVKNATDDLEEAASTGITNVTTNMDIMGREVKKWETNFEKGVRYSMSKMDEAINLWEGDREKALEEFYELGQDVQKYKNLADILSMIKGEEINDDAFTISFIALLDAVEGYYSKTRPNLGYEVRDFKAKLIGRSEDGKFSLH